MIQVIIRAIDILDYVASFNKKPVQLIHIAAHAGLSQPTAANIVKTLVEKNYLEQVSRKEGYCLGIAAYQLSRNNDYQNNLLTAAKEPMKEITSLLNETSILAVIKNYKRLILHQVECNQVLKVTAIPEANVYNAATSRLLMAYFDDKELDKLIKNVGLPSSTIWPEATTKGGLENALKKIREAEFVQLVSIHHTVGFAVPVFKNGIVIAALSIFVPQSRYTDAHKERISKLILTAAKKISAQLDT